jgi:endonuclease G
MKISVFTGPYLEADDPVMYGVQIPVMFWKIIAFVHDATGELCATGYEMSQQANLDQPEHVFANYKSPQLNILTQVPIAAIEFRTGIQVCLRASSGRAPD